MTTTPSLITADNPVQEDWDILKKFLPAHWQELARQSGALKGLRKDKDPDTCLRLLLLHFGCGHSMRTTAALAKTSGLADQSDIAVFKRVRKSAAWLESLAQALFEERREMPGACPLPKLPGGLRLLDGTSVNESGPRGSLWRVHFSFRWPQMVCDRFRLTPAKGKGNGESLCYYPLERGDYVLADRGFCHAVGFRHALERGALVTVRLSQSSVRLLDENGNPFPLKLKLRALKNPGYTKEYSVIIHDKQAGSCTAPLKARLCIIRKSHTATALEQEKQRRRANKEHQQLAPETLFFARYIMVLSTFPVDEYSTSEVLELYRVRWQIELAFKRLKQIAQLGHLPKRDPQSVRAWINGKLFIALLAEKMIAHAGAICPWGYAHEKKRESEKQAHMEPLA